MVSIGGFTRLTQSGLSITEWKPVTGILFPTNQNAWLKEMQKYKQTPEFKEYNSNITMSEFKKIYFIEYFHRLFGRITGFIFLIPFFYLIAQKKLKRHSVTRLTIVFLMGVAQGFLGWYMVKSGLAQTPSVSHYRLAAHLGMAGIILSFLCYELSLTIDIKQKKIPGKNLIVPFLLLIWLQIILGGFVAGLKAGFIYNTFPLMAGNLVPEEIYTTQINYWN